MYQDKSILICCPVLSQAGGVSNYYRIIKDYIADESHYSFFEAGGSLRSYKEIIFAAFKEAYSFAKELKKGSYHTVLLNPSLLPRAIIRNAVFLMIAKCFRKKTIVFWRGFNLTIEQKIEKYLKRIFLFFFNRADLSIVLAQEFKDKLKNMGITHPVIVSKTLVDLTKIPSSNLCMSNYNKKKLVFLSRVEKNKGIYETLEAFSILKKKIKEIKLDIVGDGPELEKVKEKYKEIKGITYHGYLKDDEKYHLLTNSSLFIFPSYSEGMPNCVLEAMACGLPVIATSVGGLKDFFIHGTNGFILEPNKPDQLAQLVIDLFENDDLFKKMSVNNFNYARANFSSEQSVEFLKNIFKATINNSENSLPAAWYK